MTAFIAITRVTIKQTLRLRRAIGLLLLSGSSAFTYLMAVIGSRVATSTSRMTTRSRRSPG